MLILVTVIRIVAIAKYYVKYHYILVAIAIEYNNINNRASNGRENIDKLNFYTNVVK